jgi:diguanylate cyclase (GGDEF)-like protein
MEAFFRALAAAARRSSVDVLVVLDTAIRAADAHIDAALFLEARDGCLSCMYTSGARAEHARRLRLYAGDASLPGRVALQAHYIVQDDDGAPLLPSDRASIAVPMISEHAIRGIWYAASCSASSVRDPDGLARLVDCACEPYLLALEREADRTYAAFDTLTGVLAPSAFRHRLHDLVATENAAVLSLWFVDTDRFKSVNDRYGHAAGDRVLQQMAALLRACAAPDVDLVGRKGGDEFCMLVRGPAKMRAIERAGAFCHAVRTHEFGIPLRITTSVGVASYPFDGRGAPELLEAADAAMYHAKRSGRDRVAYALEGSGFALYE